MEQLVNKLRFYHYIACIFEGQQKDTLCCKCKAFANSVARIEEDLAEFESSLAGGVKTLSGDLRLLLSEARSKIAVIKLPENPVGQKKAGVCTMPEGVCFIKASKAIIDKLQV